MIMKKAKLILGAMQFGERVFGDDITNMLEIFSESGNVEIDSAFVYNDGLCEIQLGESLSKIKNEKFEIATKANPRITGRLDKEAVVSQLNLSLERLKREYVDVFYLHFPDPNTPLISALEGCQQVYEEGKIKSLGLSNFPAWMVAEAYNICKSNGWILPSVYEGVYNLLSRNAERELNTALDYYGMHFYAYNPLAGGLLTNKYDDKQIKGGRFENRPNYQKRYWHDTFFESIDKIKEVCKLENIDIVEASYRWMAFHSMLNLERGDGIIVGASSAEQLKGNLSYIKNGPLPENVRNVLDSVWNISKCDAPEYFTFYKPE